MIDSQPSASGGSRPHHARVPPRRQAGSRRSNEARAPSGARWKVQLELDPAEIALVYRQGLAHGAEVCRRGTHEWRPLLTTLELRPALSARASLPSLSELLDEATPPVPTQPSEIRDPSLASLVLARRPAHAPASIAPRPPAVITARPRLPERGAKSVLPRSALAPHSAPPAPAPTLRAPSIEASVRARASILTWLAEHARPAELTLVAGIAVLLTLTASLLAERARSAQAASSRWDGSSGLASAPPTTFAELKTRAVELGPDPAIPVVAVRDLPLEGRAITAAAGPIALASALNVGSSTPAAGADAGALARVLALASRIARGCGSAPVHAQVVVTFAPSGVVRALHFGAAAPPLALRSCVLSAIARARVKPFRGGPVTVSKTLRW